MKTEIIGQLVGVTMDEHGHAFARVKFNTAIICVAITSQDFANLKVGSPATITITI